MVLGDGSKIEHVAWLQVPAPEVNFLRCNLGRSFKVDRPPPHIVALTGNIEDGGRTNEVDLTQFVKGEFERLRPVALILDRKSVV